MKKIAKKSKSSKIVKSKIDKTPVRLIVGIGSSAGGLEALEQLFMNMNLDLDKDITFVIIAHLDPKRHSYLVELIAGYTSMNVKEAEENEKILPHHVYVIPPNETLSIVKGDFHLKPKKKLSAPINSIDIFLNSMAIEYKNRCIGVVLSGTGTDGALGLQEIGRNNGLTIVQDPKNSKFSAMPKEAIKAGTIDHVLSADEIPKQILNYYDYLLSDINFDENSKKETSFLRQIYSIVQNVMGIDFTDYKSNSIIRQVNRHMIKHKIKDNVSYLKMLERYRDETKAIANSFLIGVTQFFRDPEAFLYLSKNTIPQIFKEKKDNSPIRVWVCGCSTGEEAYTLAILFKEFMSKNDISREVKIFATDINEESIKFARKGNYPANIQDDIAPQLLSKYFIKEQENFQIKNEIRRMIIFATLNIIIDPIFSNIDLTSCRNLLIYFDTKLQKKIVPLLIYSLNQNGHLFLGHSESLGSNATYFKQTSQKHRIFQINIEKKMQLALIESFNTSIPRSTHSIDGREQSLHEINLQKIVSQTILDHFSPSGVVINKENEVVYYHGKTTPYLEADTGNVDMNIFSLLNEELRSSVDSVIRKSRSQSKIAHLKNLRFRSDLLNITVSPLLDIQEGTTKKVFPFYLILFEKIPDILSSDNTNKKDNSDFQNSIELKNQMTSTKIFYENKLKNLEILNDKLLTQIDATQTTNEELQSSNEEIETSREELQAIYEELQNVVSEQDEKLKKLVEASDDMSNLLASTEIGTIFLADDLIIKRFTPAAKKIVSLSPQDIGRSITDFASALNYKKLDLDIKKVLKELISFDRYITTESNATYHMRIHPYRTVENRIDGVVLTFVDITEYERFITEG